MFRSSRSQEKKRPLRSGFSTGTAMAAAARGALRLLLSGNAVDVIAVRLPNDCLMPVKIHSGQISPTGASACASVIKDGGDDPDVTHKAEIRVNLRILNASGQEGSSAGCRRFVQEAGGSSAMIRLIAGEGVGVVTKPGLPVHVDEPAVNPVPRQMLCRNLAEELLSLKLDSNIGLRQKTTNDPSPKPPAKPSVLIPLTGLPETLGEFLMEVEVHVPNGQKLAERTLNPRLGVVGGISILGTTGLVKPFSHEAYEETIQSALSVARSNGCREIILSTGGKSERFAQGYLTGRSLEAFVQIADFYAFSLQEVRKMGFEEVVHSVFFGKLVKMAQGLPYTHAHKASLDLETVARVAEEKRYGPAFCRDLEAANTARHALQLLLGRKALDVVDSLAKRALHNSRQIAGDDVRVRIILFDYDGTILVDTDR